MNIVQTVLGPVAALDLGTTLMHEHVAFDSYERPAERTGYNWDEVTQAASAELSEAFAEGVRTFVDCTPIGNERSPASFVDIAQRTGLHLVASTGFWIDPPLARLVGTEDVDHIADLMVSDIQNGMDGTNIRAGIIKVATSVKMTSREERVLRAAVMASQRTGAAITTHTERGAYAREQVDFFARAGANLSRVVIGHVGGNPDLRLHVELAERGVYLGYDRVGQGHVQDDDAIVELFAEMTRRGYQRQMLLSQDTSIFLFGRKRPPLPKHLGGHSINERPAYTHLWHGFIPRLRARGVTEQDLRTILVENPASLLLLSKVVNV